MWALGQVQKPLTVDFPGIEDPWTFHTPSALTVLYTLFVCALSTGTPTPSHGPTIVLFKTLLKNYSC